MRYVKDIMTSDVKVLTPETTVQVAAKSMKTVDAGAFPVVVGSRVVGTITDRDITIRATAEGADPKTTKVNEVMSKDVFCCFDDQESADVARTMQVKQVRRMPVLSRKSGALVGMISLADLAVKTKDAELAGKTLQCISEKGESSGSC